MSCCGGTGVLSHLTRKFSLFPPSLSLTLLLLLLLPNPLSLNGLPWYHLGRMPTGVVQASYRITVTKVGASTPVWDSGDVVGTANNEIEYSGKALTPFTAYVWTAEWTPVAAHEHAAAVRVATAVRSAPASAAFETGPMSDADWQQAHWLVTEGLLRFPFTLPAGATVARARAYIASPGCHVLQVNGAIPTPDYRGICPWVVHSSTDTYRNTRYQTHDITQSLSTGDNVLGIIAGAS